MTSKDLLLLSDDVHFRWEDVTEAVEKFRKFLSPDFPKLEAMENLDVLNWEHQTGVYLIFDRNFSLFYVGKTTVNFKNRISEHENEFECPIIDLIVFPENIRCFIPALERFLIKELQPPKNIMHKR